MTDSELLQFCRHVCPFDALPEAAYKALIASSRRKSFAAKEYIFFEGAEGDAGYLVLRGRVALVKASPSGREIIMELHPAGQLFGVIVLINNRPYPLSARAQCESEVLAIPRPAIAAAADAHPSMLQAFLQIISQRLHSAHNVARSLAHDKVEVRIASAILALLGQGQTDIEISRQELADLTGTTIETASRLCKLWERDEIVELPQQGLVRVRNLLALRDIVRVD